MSLFNKEALFYSLITFKGRGYCIWCKEHAEEWQFKKPRPTLSELINEEQSATRKRQSKT
jgi:hypothetical protein